MSAKPLTPAEAVGLKNEMIPDKVIVIFNQVIAKHFVNDRSSFKQDEVVDLLVADGFKRKELFDNHWLDVEDIYRDAGWKVVYDKPGYNESGAAIFTFIANTKS